MWSSNHLLSIATILQNSYSIRIDSQPACRYKNIRPLISFTLIRLRAPLCDSASDCGIFGVCKRLRANAGAPQPFRPITLFYVQTRASVRPYGLLQIRKLVFHRKMPWMKRTNIISSRSFECDDDDFASMLTADNNRINELNAIHAIASGESVCVRSFRLWSLFLCRLSLFFVVGHHFEDDNVSSVRR